MPVATSIASASAAASARPPSAAATAASRTSTTIRTIPLCTHRSAFAVIVGLAFLRLSGAELTFATLDGQRAAWLSLGSDAALGCNPPAHLGTLFLQNSFARKSNAIALYGEHLYQDLVAFLEF